MYFYASSEAVILFEGWTTKALPGELRVGNHTSPLASYPIRGIFWTGGYKAINKLGENAVLPPPPSPWLRMVFGILLLTYPLTPPPSLPDHPYWTFQQEIPDLTMEANFSGFVASCLLVAAVSALYEGFKCMRQYLANQSASENPERQPIISTTGSPNSKTDLKPKW